MKNMQRFHIVPEIDGVHIRLNHRISACGNYCLAGEVIEAIMTLEKERHEAIFARDVAENLDRHLRELATHTSQQRDAALAKVKVITDYCRDILSASQTERGAQFTADWILRKLGEA